MVQRIGNGVIGGFFMLMGSFSFLLPKDRQSIFSGVIAILSFLRGGRLFLNAFKRHPKPPKE
jgi:hypothetical protein